MSRRLFARWWMHNAWVTSSGEKMSKSLGNSLLIPEVLKRVRGIELRFYMVAVHYRSHVEFSFEALDESHPQLGELVGSDEKFAAQNAAMAEPRCGVPWLSS